MNCTGCGNPIDQARRLCDGCVRLTNEQQVAIISRYLREGTTRIVPQTPRAFDPRVVRAPLTLKRRAA